MQYSSAWMWGLCLIVLTTAIHSLGIVLMSILGLRIRAGLKRRRVAFWQGVAILTGLIAAIGLSLAVLHGIEAPLWAVAYTAYVFAVMQFYWPILQAIRQH
jgi:hypothetical protein